MASDPGAEDRWSEREPTTDDHCELVVDFQSSIVVCGRQAVTVGVIDSVTFGTVEFPRCEEHRDG